MLRRSLLGPLLVAVLVTAGCSGGAADDPPPAPADPAPASAAPASPSSASPTVSTLPVEQCLTGRYRLVRFVGVGASQTYGTGQGGDLDLTFRGGKAYTLDGDGQKPVVLTLAGRTADLAVNGTAKGTYAVQGTAATFHSTSTDGSATLSSGEQQQRLSMRQIASVIGLDGKAQVACTADAMTVTLQTVRLEFGRV